MSRGEQDLDYNPRISKAKPVRSSRRTRKVEPVDYSEAEGESETEGETTLSESGTIVVDSPRQGEIKEDTEEDWKLSQIWTPNTLVSNVRQIGDQAATIVERSMFETNNLEKLMEMMVKMRMEDKREERERKGNNKEIGKRERERKKH